MHTNRIRIISLAATLALVPLAAESAWARPDPGPSPTTSHLRPDGFDPGWDRYGYGSPSERPDGVLAGDVRGLEVTRDRGAYDPGGSVYESQVPRQAWPTTAPRGEDETGTQQYPGHAPGGSIYRSQVPRAAWER